MLRPLAVLLALSGLAAPAVAQEQSFRSEYSVTLHGLPVATASFDSTFSQDKFIVEGELASSGLGNLFSKTNATTKVQGRLGVNGAQPLSFVSRYRTGKKKGSTAIRFRGDTVLSAVNKPETKRGSRWIPVPPEELKAALDPITSTLIRAAKPEEVCARTIRFFDGELRGDLKLSHRGAQQVSGFKEPAVACNVRFIPVAGYRKGRKQIEYLKEKSRITIAFARLGTTGFYVPVDSSIGTQAGTLRITARSITARSVKSQ